MGLLVEGKWQDKWYDTESTGGKFKRDEARVRNWVTADGSAGPRGEGGFAAESGRYHLYVSLACPWANRTLIFRELKELQQHMTLSIVSYEMMDKGWTFDTDKGSTGDSANGCAHLHELYTLHDAHYTGRVTVPVLWDKKRTCIVNNESSEIIRMLNSAFNELTGNHDDFYPEPLRAAIDQVNDLVYNDVNNGVYRSGFATTQRAYEEAYDSLFSALDRLEETLDTKRYLTGSDVTEADWRLFTTLIRFDSVYHGHFKCNKQRLEDYPNLSNYLRELYQWQGVENTVNFAHIKQHYYVSHTMINPTQIVPKGPEIDYSRPHNRGRLS